jgi:hypothetical protein
MRYGDYRSACAKGLWGQAYIIANNIDHPDERNIAINNWWRNADLEEVVTHLVWSVYSDNSGKMKVLSEFLTRGHHYSENAMCNLHLFDHLLLSNHIFDLESLYIEWALVVSRSVLPLFEAWATAYAPEHLYAMRCALDAVQHGDPSTLSPELLELIFQAMRAAGTTDLTVDDVERLVETRGLDEQDAVFKAANELLLLYDEAMDAWDEVDEADEPNGYEAQFADECQDALEDGWDSLKYEILRSDAENISKLIAYSAAYSIIVSLKSYDKKSTTSTGVIWAAKAQSIFDALGELKILENKEIDYKLWDKFCINSFEFNLKKMNRNWSLHVLKTLRANFLAQQ